MDLTFENCPLFGAFSFDLIGSVYIACTQWTDQFRQIEHGDEVFCKPRAAKKTSAQQKNVNEWKGFVPQVQ